MTLNLNGDLRRSRTPFMIRGHCGKHKTLNIDYLVVLDVVNVLRRVRAEN